MLRLLLIDDNPDDRTIIIRELRREFPELQVEEVIEAQGFQQALNAGNFNLAITDYCLGWNDGLSVFRELKSRIPNCPVIMFTGSGNQEIAVEAMKAGVDDYIIKSAKHYVRLPVAVRSALRQTQDSIKLLQAEAALRESEERFRLLVESAKDYGIFTLDSNGYVTSWNEGAKRILGYQEAEIIGQHGSCIFTPEDRRAGVPEQELQTAVAVGRAEDERWHLRSDGTRFWASGILTAIRDEAGNLLSFSKIMRDMTERKQAEEQIQRLNTDLERQVTERTAQLHQALEFEAMLKRITDKVRDSLDESHILQSAVQELALGLEINGCDTAIYDLNLGSSTITYEQICSELPPALGQVAKMAERPEYTQLLQGQYIHFCWLLPFPDLIRKITKRFTVLACPIIDEQQVLGDMWLFQPNTAYFTEPEIRLVQQVTSQCALAQAGACPPSLSAKPDFIKQQRHKLRNWKNSTALKMISLTLFPMSYARQCLASKWRFLC